MKSKILAAILLFASLSFAQYNEGNDTVQNSDTTEYATQDDFQKTSNSTIYSPKSNTDQKSNPSYHARKGFHFSVNSGVAYTYVRDTHHGINRIEDKNFSAVVNCDEFRFGYSIANMVTFYLALGAGVGTGTFKDKDIVDSKSGSIKENNDNSYRYLVAIGSDFYPIQDRESPFYGLFLGLEFGFVLDIVNVSEHSFDKIYKNKKTTSDFGNLFLRFEAGKDWWFSRRWSIGIAVNYAFGYLEYEYGSGWDDEGNLYPQKGIYVIHNIGLNLRIAH